jgi:biopolymer transport protein ExbD
MAMNMGKGGGPVADINVTPLIDIVLVLLIIFMVLTPMSQRGYDLSIPEKAQAELTQAVAAEQLVVVITADGRLLINKEETADASLRTKLEDLLRGRREKTVFFNADDATIYQKAISAMDAIRAAGGTVGLVTTDLK